MKNSFSINTIFLVLAIIGLSLIPLLSVQLHPSTEGNQLYVSYAWNDISAEILEKEVTSPLEGALASIKGLKEIRSSSSKGYGYISLEFKKGTDMDAVRFEVGSLMRHIYSKLPEGVGRPRVSMQNQNEGDRKLLMTYTLNGEGTTLSLQQYANDHIVPALSLLHQVDQVQATGATPLEWELSYDPYQLQTLQLRPQDLQAAITGHLQQEELGGSTLHEAGRDRFVFLSFRGQPHDSLIWDRIPVANHHGRVLKLTDLARVRLKEQKPRSYFRINGLNTIYLNIYTTKGANQIQVAERVHQAVETMKSGFPANFSLLVSYDASEQLREETSKILFRSGLAIVILLLFVLAISQQWRYLTVIGLSLVANLAIAVIFYYWLQIEIHLYSLAGITVSLGIIIDNTIVMADHLRFHRNNKVFLAVLAATLTTMGALSIIFFLNEKQRLNLADFALVMIVNLAVSLFIALFFIPALMDKIPLHKKQGKRFVKRKKRVVKITRGYERFIRFGYRFKWAFIVVAIWGFGIPFFLLPDRLGKEHQADEELQSYEQWYNQSLGNSTFVSEVKPWINKIFGGSLYYFTSYMAEQNFNWDQQRTQLTVNVSMPDGATLQQMNKLFLELENYLASFDEIDRFISRITGIDRSSIQITFKKEAEMSLFPYYLKQLMETKAVETGGADFGIFGVGRGFSNKLHEGYHNSSIALYGYNFDELMTHARFLKGELLKHQRIKEVFIRTDNSYWGKPRYEYVADVDAQSLAGSGTSIGQLFGQLSQLTQAETKAGYVPLQKEFLPVVLRPQSNENAGIWNLLNHPVVGYEQQALRLKNVAGISKERASSSINKTNQQYKVSVTYDFIGPHQLSERVLKRNIEMINKYLPLGFSAESGRRGWQWDHGEKKQYWLLFLVMVIVYFICAILLESLLQPLAVIATIPLSFIGVFVTFTLFKFPFDQGGYASMVLLCGLTVNSALYIINDYNNNRRRKPGVLKLRHYLRGFNHKITPILLTILSTALGLIPFLIGGKGEGFWFSLAVGAIGGLVFSLVAIVVWLPLFMSVILQRTAKKKGNAKGR
ncbi:MAG: efflux RND transporter permease subunit, partial [Marinilabiliaceae bacterium]|nr:efflux RND transporter permease subunit [Marinilabiliaceae bacterium]